MNHLIPLLNVTYHHWILKKKIPISLGPGMMERRKWSDVMQKTMFTYCHVPILFLWFLLITKYINELTRLMDSGKDCPSMQETQVQSLGGEDVLEKEITWQPIPVFLPGNFHRQRSLVGYSPWGHWRGWVTGHTG